MKKSNRIARKGDAARTRAQSKANPTSLADSGAVPPKKAKRPADDGEPRPLPTRRKCSPALTAELRRFLSLKSFALLAGIEERYGVSIEAQLAAALGSWTGHVAWQVQSHPGYSAEYLRKHLQEDAFALDPGQVEYLVEEGLAKKASVMGARLFLDVVTKAQAMPFEEGRPLLAGLRDLVKGNPAYQAESKRVRDWMDAGESLGSHHLYTRAGREIPPCPLLD